MDWSVIYVGLVACGFWYKSFCLFEKQPYEHMQRISKSLFHFILSTYKNRPADRSRFFIQYLKEQCIRLIIHDPMSDWYRPSFNYKV